MKVVFASLCSDVPVVSKAALCSDLVKLVMDENRGMKALQIMEIDPAL